MVSEMLLRLLNVVPAGLDFLALGQEVIFLELQISQHFQIFQTVNSTSFIYLIIKDCIDSVKAISMQVCCREGETSVYLSRLP